MSNVAVRKIEEKAEAARHFFEEVGRMFEEIRQRAFELFANRGCAAGKDLDDWLEAERELLWTPPAGMVESEREFRVRVAAPGFDAKDLQVTALPGAVVIQAETKKEEEKKDEKLRISELSTRKLYRRIDLPLPVDMERVTAALDKGMLEVVAAKAGPVREKKVFVAGGRHAA
jgi:HSP20 family protein